MLPIEQSNRIIKKLEIFIYLSVNEPKQGGSVAEWLGRPT